MVIRNLMSGGGFEGGAYGGEWFSAWIAVGILGVILFFEYMFFVKEDYSPAPFSFAGSLIGILLCILIITFTGWIKVAFIVGVIGTALGGFGIARFTDG